MAKKQPEDPSPDKLIRDQPRRYHTADGRFEAQSEPTGSWYLSDTESTDELGLPRLIGPFGTLDAVREAITEARTSGGGQQSAGPPRLRVVGADEAAGTADVEPDAAKAAKPARPASKAGRSPAKKATDDDAAVAAVEAAEEAEADRADEKAATTGKRTPSRAATRPAAKPARASWLDRLEPPDRARAAKLIAALEALGIRDPEQTVRADLDASLPRIAPAVLLAEIWSDDLATLADEAWIDDLAAAKRGRDLRRDAAEAVRRLLDAGADAADLAALGRLAGAEAAGLVLERVSLGGRGRASRRQLPSWRLVEIGTDGDPTGRTILISEEDLVRAAREPAEED